MFTREELRNIGIENEKVEEIMALHGKDVQELKEKEEQAQSKANEAQEEIKSYKQRVAETNNQLEELRSKVNSGEDLNKQVEALKQANDQKDKEHQEQMNKVKLSYEIDKELDRAGAKNSIAVMALVNKDNVKLSDDGVKGLSEQLEKLKETDSYLFNADNSNQTNNQSGGNDNNGQSGSNDQSGGGIDYNAGQSRGNNGNPQADGALGRSNAERLFGNKK